MKAKLLLGVSFVALIVGGCAAVVPEPAERPAFIPTEEVPSVTEQAAEYPEEPAADPVVEQTEGWRVYADADYGFTFRYPPEWTLTEDPGGYQLAGGTAAPSITLHRGTLCLRIQFKRPEETTVLGPGGRPAGEVEERDFTSLGHHLERQQQGEARGAPAAQPPPELSFAGCRHPTALLSVDDESGAGRRASPAAPRLARRGLPVSVTSG